MMLNSKSINHARQNKPTLIVNDMARVGVDPSYAYHSLLKRGVFKWFKARREVIRLKNALKDKIRMSIDEQKATRSGARKQYIRGYRKALEECRKELRLICHQPRFTAPDNDRHARRFLNELWKKNVIKGGK